MSSCYCVIHSVEMAVNWGLAQQNVLDRFHIMAHLHKAINVIRAGEAVMDVDGYEPMWENSRCVLFKRPGKLTNKRELKLVQLLRYNLKSIRNYLLKVDFQPLRTSTNPTKAVKALDA